MSAEGDVPDPVEELMAKAEAHLRDEGERDDASAVEWQPVDLLLEQGTVEEVTQMRRAVAASPSLALELADTVQLIEAFRELKVEASPNMAGKMQAVMMQAERSAAHRGRARPRRWLPPITFAAAAAAAFWLLSWLDVASFWQAPGREAAVVVAVSAQAAEPRSERDRLVEPEAIVDASELAWQEAVATIQRRLEVEDSDHLQAALSAGLRQPTKDLAKWLDPANAVTMMRLGHELRSSAERRARALRSAGSLPEVDRRVQQIATSIAAELRDIELADEADVVGRRLGEVSWGVRALIGAGSNAVRGDILRRCGQWLASSAEDLHDERLVVALAGLVELAGARGEHVDAVAVHGARLVDSVLDVDDETWQRRRPALLAGVVPSQVLGDAGRVLARLPAFGVDPDRCTLVRQLMLGRLREQRSSGQDRPEVLAAMCYGFRDLLDREGNEHGRLSWALRRWKLTRLAPDFATVQQMAWSMTPGTQGYTRMQRELRQLAVVPSPQELAGRAAFCLCLATNFAGYVQGLAGSTRDLRGS